MVILCYGDSNTYGTKPWKGYSERYNANQRWTKLLQKTFGEDFEVIEEGLPGRTINIDDSKRVVLNGLTTFGSTLLSHNLIDWIVLMLGTNDCKIKFDQRPEQMIEGIEKYLDLIERYSSNSKVLLVAPAPVNDVIANNSNTPNSFIGAEEKGKKFAHLLHKLALNKKCYFLDLGTFITVSKVDGIHFDLENQAIISDALYQLIKDHINT